MSLVVLCNLHPQLLFYRKFNSGHFQTIHGAPFKASTSKYQQQQLEVWSTIFSKIFVMSSMLQNFWGMGDIFWVKKALPKIRRRLFLEALVLVFLGVLYRPTSNFVGMGLSLCNVAYFSVTLSYSLYYVI